MTFEGLYRLKEMATKGKRKGKRKKLERIHLQKKSNIILYEM